MKTQLLEIRSLGASGEGVGTLDGYTVFVEGALPGERVEVELVQSKKTYGVGRLVAVERPSERRVKPACPVYGECGGCQLMHLSYEGQLEAKRQRVVDALERIAGLKGIEVAPCLGADEPWGYRHKIQMPVGEQLQLGLYARGSHRLVPVDRCLIHCNQGEELLGTIRGLLQSSGLRAYVESSGKGTLRHLVVRTATTGEQLVILVTTGQQLEACRQLATQLMERAASVRGVVACINGRRDNRILTDQWEQLAGVGWLTERVAEMDFRISAGSFFQVFPAQAGRLVELVEAMAGPGGGRTALDGCCGVGLMALALARLGWSVQGVEVSQEAIGDARWNAQANSLHATFECQQLEAAIADLVLLNPPRGGIEERVLEGIQAERIIYISCDPATLARDIKRLSGYAVQRVQPVDLFPQTAHVETVAILHRIF